MSFHRDQHYPTSESDRIERDQSRKSNALIFLVAALCIATTTSITIFSTYLTLLLQWDGAFRDLWEFVDDIERQWRGEWSLDYLLEAYGGAHRIFLPKLLFFADYYWFGGRNGLTIFTSLLCQCIYLWIIVRTLRQQPLLTAAERSILAAGFVLALFSTTQISNFLYAMDVQWYMSNLLGLASLAILAASNDSLLRWTGVLLSGLAAALCNFTGLMALPVAMLAILFTQHTIRYRWALLALLTAICLQYVSHEKNSQQVVFSALQHSDNWQTSLYIVLDTLSKMAPYLLRYLSSPLSREWPLAGSLLAAGGIAITIVYWLRHWRGAQLSSWQRLCLYIATYIVASGFFTAFGRIIYPNSAVAERYQTLVLPWLPALFGMIWPDWRQHRHAVIVLLLWLLVFGTYLLPSQPLSARDMAALSHRVHLAHTAARAGVLEHPFITATLSHPLIKNGINSVKDNDAFLRSHRLGYFTQLPEFALGTQVDYLAGLPACSGQSTLRLDETGVAWLLDGQLLAAGKPVTDIIVQQDGQVIGLGILLRQDGFWLPRVWQPAEKTRFRTFISHDRLQTGSALILLGVLDGKAVCQHSFSPVTAP